MHDRPAATVLDRLRPMLRATFLLCTWLAAAIGAALVLFPLPRGPYRRDAPEPPLTAIVRPVDKGEDAAELRLVLRSERRHPLSEEEKEEWDGPFFLSPSIRGYSEWEFGPVALTRRFWPERAGDDVRDRTQWTARLARWGLLAAFVPAVLLAIGYGVWRGNRDAVLPPTGGRAAALRRWGRAAGAAGRPYLYAVAAFGVLAFTLPLHGGRGPRFAAPWLPPRMPPGLSAGWAAPPPPEVAADPSWPYGPVTERPLGLGCVVQRSALPNWPDGEGGREDLRVTTLFVPRWIALLAPLPFALWGLWRLRRERRAAVPANPPADD